MLADHLSAGWCWCPVLQGQAVEDYLRHAVDVAGWVYELRDVYAARGQVGAFRVCLGSLCRRNAANKIRAIVRAVAAVLPDLPLHLFGVKLGLLRQAGRLSDAVASLDSAAWSGRFGRDLDRCTDEQRRTCTACRVVVRPRLGPRPTVCPGCGGPLGASQREYTVLIALPRYRARVERALLAHGRGLGDRGARGSPSPRLPRQTLLPWAAEPPSALAG